MKFYLYLMGYYILTRGFGDLIISEQYLFATVVFIANFMLITDFSKTYNADAWKKEE